VGWLLPLAAGIAVVAVTLAAWLGFLAAEQSRHIADLNRRLDEATERSARLASDRSELDSRARELSYQLALVSSPGVAVCPLRPMGASPPQPEAHGLLFLSPERGAWYLRIRHLDPDPDGGVYMLWFLRDDAPINGGVLEPGPDHDVQLVDQHMPTGRWMNGVAITLERSATVARPSGPVVLFGDEKMDMI
jgi:hypothetical protein